MFIISLLIGIILGTIFGYKVGVFAGKRKKIKAAKPKPLTFEEMMIQATKMPTGDTDLAAEVDADIEKRLREV